MRITIQDVQDSLGITNTYDIVNAITNDDPATFGQYVPLATADNVAEIGAALLMSPRLLNEFVNQLVNRIGLVVVRSVHLKNPLKKFKKGQMPQGYTIEEIFTDITTAKKYNPSDAENTLFKRTIPNVKTLFHELDRQEFYEQTINEDQLRQAFTSWAKFGNFTSSIIQAIYNSAEVDEYRYMKLLIDNYYSKGLFKVVPVQQPVDQASSTSLVKALRSTSLKMTIGSGSRDYNALAVHTVTNMNDLHLIIDADTFTEINVDVLASAFNMSKVDFMGNVTIVDNFASTGLVAVLVDKDWFMVYDNLFRMNTVQNAKGLYWNYFLHIWQVLSVSRFQNAVAFAYGNVKSVTSVIVSPSITALQQGNSMEFTSYVRQTDNGNYPLTWSVVGNTASDMVVSGTSIDQSGNLTVGATQTGELMVKASVSITNGFTTTLTADASTGATTIDVADASGLVVGDSIVIGTEPTAIAISSISGETVTLASGLTANQTADATVKQHETIVGQAVVTVTSAS